MPHRLLERRVEFGRRVALSHTGLGRSRPPILLRLASPCRHPNLSPRTRSTSSRIQLSSSNRCSSINTHSLEQSEDGQVSNGGGLAEGAIWGPKIGIGRYQSVSLPGGVILKIGRS